MSINVNKNKFKTYLEILKNLDTEKSFFKKYEKEDKLVILLSGSSNFETAALSDEQKDFLSLFEKFSYKIIESNFPYNIEFPYQKYDEINIVKASCKVICYYIHTLKNKKFHKEIKRHLSFILNIKELIIITQSSGLNILNKFLDLLDNDELEKIKTQNIQIFSLGPVAKKNKKFEILNYKIVKGKLDEYSKKFDFHKADIWIDCKHLEYLKNKELREYIYEYLQKN